MLSLLITVLLKLAIQCCETVIPQCVIYVSQLRYWNILNMVLQSCVPECTIQSVVCFAKLWYQNILYRGLQSCDTTTYCADCYKSLVPERLIQ